MSSSSGRLKTIVNVALLRPRRMSDTRNFIDFSRITGVVWNLLHGIKVSEKRSILEHRPCSPTLRRKNKSADSVALKWSGLVLLVAVWEALAQARVFAPQFFPPFTETVASVGKMLASGLLFTSVMVSLWRASVDLLIAVAAAIPLGLFFGIGEAVKIAVGAWLCF